jgi:hypothetical protein
MSELRTLACCGALLLTISSVCLGQQPKSGAPPTGRQDPHSAQAMKGGGPLEQQLQLQKQQLQLQEQWLRLQQEQLETQKQQLQFQKEQQARHLGFWDRFWQVLPSVITALMALVVALIVRNFNHWSTRRTARQDHIRMLMEIDSRLIERPYLWTVYGYEVAPAVGKEEALKKLLSETENYRELQEDALMYAFFNMFEAVFDFHTHLGFFGWRRIPRAILSKVMFWSDRRRSDKEYKDSWDRFANDFFSDKKGRRSWELFHRQKNLYSKSFQEWVAKVRESATTTPSAVPAAASPVITSAKPAGSSTEAAIDNSTKPKAP